MKLLMTLGLAFGALLINAIAVNTIQAADPKVDSSASNAWPANVDIKCGKVETKIDGPKMWTMSGIKYDGKVMAVEDSAYGTVVTIPGIEHGHLGTAHFLEVPGKPGEIEKENVLSLKFFADDKPVSPDQPISGKTVRIERLSKIRTLELDQRILIQDDVVIQSSRIQSPVDFPLKMSYPLMYAWTSTATEFLFGGGESEVAGKFIPNLKAKPVEGLQKNAKWMAVYDAPTGKAAVAVLLTKPADADVWLQYTDAPGIYRKLRFMSFVDKTIPAGFDGTFRVATGFLKASAKEWKDAARKRAAELQAIKY